MDSEEQLLNNAHLYMTCISETRQCLPRVARSWVRAPVGPNQKLKKKCICCFVAKNTVFRSKSKEWLAHNQNNLSEWSDTSTRGLLFPWANTTSTAKRVGLVQRRHHYHLPGCNLFSPWYARKKTSHYRSFKHISTGVIPVNSGTSRKGCMNR